MFTLASFPQNVHQNQGLICAQTNCESHETCDMGSEHVDKLMEHV